ncbi:MAG: TatD family hydrolase [Bacteroidales bacterium]|nr:TatD family hydrolase [Bacteroidales bacterium]
MNYIDTHTHLYDAAFEGKGLEAIERAVAAGVVKFVVPGTSSLDYGDVLTLCASAPGVAFPALGLHPEEVGAGWKDEIAILETQPFEKLCAIGEIGLDLHWSSKFEKEQTEAFKVQLELARERDLPVIIHSRDATEKTLNAIREVGGRGLRGVFHAYSGSAGTFREIMRLGGDWYIGIGGVVTYKKSNLPATLAEIPLEKILLETDSPYLPPVPHRGERNESAYIPLIAGKIAEAKGVSPEEVARVTSAGASSLFGI